MRKNIFKIFSVFFCFIILSFPLYTGFSASEVENTSKPSYSKVRETKFLNLLNHNFVYNKDYESLENIVNNSLIALLDYKEDDYISQAVVNGYLYDMYGFSIDDYSSINKRLPQKDGYVYVLPRGYTKYNHKPIFSKINDDGTFTFVTEVTVLTHDGQNRVCKCETMLIENENSVFGYNIVRSNITEINNSI